MIHMEMDDKSGVCCLTVKSSRKDDMGEYECMAKNKAGEASTYCEVTIDQVSESDEGSRNKDRPKHVKYGNKIDLAKGMSTDVMDSDGDESPGK